VEREDSASGSTRAVLCHPELQGAPFNEPKHKNLAGKVAGAKSEDAKIEMLLDVADSGIGEKMSAFEGEQATGEKLNEVTETYYKKNPRPVDDEWPSANHTKIDMAFRQFFDRHTMGPKLPTPSEVAKFAKSELSIQI